MSPREFELLCAGYLWREERAQDRMVIQMSAMTKDADKLLRGRKLGESRVRGYRAPR